MKTKPRQTRSVKPVSTKKWNTAELAVLEKIKENETQKTREKLLEIRQRIPAEMRILSHTIKIEFVMDLLEEKDAFGFSYYNKNLIVLQFPTESVSMDQVFHTFWHELIHFVFFFGGHTMTLKDNEPLVDIVGGILAQATMSAKYPVDEEKIELEVKQILKGTQ